MKTTSSIPVRLVLFLVAVVWFAPFLWGLSSSFKPSAEIFARPPHFLPQDGTFGNYQEVWSGGTYARFFLNSAVIAVGSTLLYLAISSLTGYALAKFRFVGRDVFFFVFVGTMMIPMQVTMIPVFFVTSRLGLADTYWAVILPMAAQGFGVFLMRQFMLSVPTELIESGRIDGAGELRIFTTIALPLAKPAIGTLAILAFLESWNNFIWPLILLSSRHMATVQLALRRFQTLFGVQWHLLMAASFLAVVPVLVVFVVLQKRIVAGISMTGLKY